MPEILLFDNYDSFSFNLVHLVEKIMHTKIDVSRNDEIPLEDIKKYDKIILSPGPGIPLEANFLLPLIKEYASTKSILGVCLGHQAIGEAFGATLENLDTVFHGVATPVKFLEEGSGLFQGIAPRQMVGRYHSWIISRHHFPEEFEITSVDEHDYIMSVRHKKFDVQGVQFHPESVLTACGEQILRNWLLN